MKRSMPLLALLILLILTSISAAFAQVTAVPQLMNFQGRLTRSDGTPVPNGIYSVRFSLWTAASGGAEKWNQTVNPVTVRNGTFAALLSNFPAGTFNSNLFLEIKIGTNSPLTPRQQLVTVAYAMKADSVKDGSITGASIAGGSITTDKFAANIFNPLAWLLNGNSGVTSGFVGTTDNNPLELRMNNRRVLRYNYLDYSTNGFGYRAVNVLGGSEINSIAGGVAGATIAGGGEDGINVSVVDHPNRINTNFGTIGGGSDNTATGIYATIAGGNSNSTGSVYTTVGGGASNTASGASSTVAGGFVNTASGSTATVGGGSGNTASGSGATVAGGSSNLAAGNFSFAAGNHAKANHAGAFVWADSSGGDFTSTANDQFLIRAVSGVGIGRNNPEQMLHVAGNIRADGGEYQSWGGITLHPDVDNTGDDIVRTVDSAGNETMRVDFNGNVGIGTASPAYKLQVAGSVGATGFTNTSDARYKQNVATFPNALDTILNLRGVTFDWKQQAFPDMNFSAGKQIGFIAQEVEQILPELVTTDSKGYKSVAYQNVVPVLVEAVKMLKKENAAIQKDHAAKTQRLAAVEAKNAELEARLERLEAALRSQK